MALEERQPSGEVTPIHQVWYYQVLPKRNVFLEASRVCEKKQKSIFRTWISIDLITALRDTSQCTFEYSTFVDEILNEVQCPISKQSFSKTNSF